MNIGELFINLGIKGSEKTVGALGGVKKSLGEVSSMSLEAKAGLIAVLYALERLTSASFATGNDLKNFSTETGVSAKTLQQYEYAAKRVGVSNQEIEGTFKNLQGAMTKALMGKGVPEGIGLIGRTLKQNFTADSLRDFAAHPEKLMQILQKYAQTEKNVGIRNEALKSFGIGDNTIAAMVTNQFRPDVLNKAPLISDKELDSLQKGNAALSDLGNHIEKAFAHFNAKHGTQMVADITKIVDAIILLINKLTVLGDKIHVFDGLTTALNGISNLIGVISGEGPKALKPGEKVIGGDSWIVKKLAALQATVLDTNARTIEPNIRRTQPGTTTHSTTVNQNLNFQHDGKDHQRNSDSHKKAARDAYRQNSALTRGA